MSEDNTEEVQTTQNPKANMITQLLQQQEDSFALLNHRLISMASKDKFDRGDILKALYAARDSMNSIKIMCNLFIQDLMIVDKRLSTIEYQLFQNINQHLTLTAAILEKKLVTEEELKQAWEKEVMPRLESSLKEARGETQTEGTSSDTPTSPETTSEPIISE
jgi:hypothetical protein